MTVYTISMPTGRRKFLSTSAAVAALSGAAVATASSAPTGADATVIALAAELCRLEADYSRLCWSTDPQDNRPGKAEALVVFEAQEDRREAVQAELADAVPQTFAGLQAKARAILSADVEYMLQGGGAAALTLSLIRNVAGRA